MNRRGFTLTELLVATVVMAILGTALARMLISDSRFVSRVDAMANARHSAVAAMNTMTLELRMISDGGLIAAEPDSVTVRVPYAFGMLCRNTGGSTIASLVPADSVMYERYASAPLGGVAWRDVAGSYQFESGRTVGNSALTTECTDDSIRVIPGGRLISISPEIPSPPAGSGRLMYVYQTVTYRFGPSTELAGRVGLWRRVGTAAPEELVAPFDTAAGFAFLVGSDLASQASPPADLSTVRGLELQLIGSSEATPQGSSEPEKFDLLTNLLFLNKQN